MKLAEYWRNFREILVEFFGFRGKDLWIRNKIAIFVELK